MYPSWTTASCTISPSTGAVASSCGMLAVFPATAVAATEEAVRRALDADDRLHERGQERRDDERRGQPDDERDLPVAVCEIREASFAHRHLSQRARRVEDPHPGVVDPGDAAELGRLVTHDPDRPDGRLGLLWRSGLRTATIVITITAATAMTTTPSPRPTSHRVDSEVSMTM